MKQSRFYKFVTIGLLVLFCAYIGYLLIRKHIDVQPDGQTIMRSDVLTYVLAADRMIQNADIYFFSPGQETGYVYPPFYAFANIPLTLAPPLAIDIFWYIFNIGLLIGTIRCGYILLTGELFSALSSKDQWLYAGGSILLSIRYLVRGFQDANVSMLLVFLIVYGLMSIERRKNSYGAIWMGVAAAIKVLPLVFLLYFIFFRKWKELFIVSVVFLFCTFMPIIYLGIPRFMECMNSFIDYTRIQFSPAGLSRENFSFWGTLGRLFTHTDAQLGPDGKPIFINIANYPVLYVKSVIIGINASLILLYGLTLYYFRKSYSDSRSHAGKEELFRMLPMLITLMLGNLLSVLTEDHHMIPLMMVYLFLLIGIRGHYFSTRIPVIITLGTGIASIILNYDIMVPLIGKLNYLILLGYSLPTFGVTLLLFALLLALLYYPGRLWRKERERTVIANAVPV
ncbi:MAG: glycosyltransferase family 87 protein [Bacteroidota bacterium]